jgi:Tol biopolymer transport system component
MPSQPSGGSRRGVAIALVTVVLLAAGLAGPATAKQLGAWAPAVSAESLPGTSSELNSSSNDGCPIQSPDGLHLYQASNRPGGLGGIDIWVASRASTSEPYGAPVNLGAPINSAADDFCPTPVRGKGLFFVSSRAIAGACGGPDIYFSRDNPAHGWTTPVNLGCQVNSAVAEMGPSYFEAGGRAYLYFSSGPDIYMSVRGADGTFGPRTAVAELNSAANDLRPNVRKGGLEVVFDSDRPGTLGGPDLWFATRASVSDPWSTPVNAGPAINTAAGESRGSFSWDGATLYFGRGPGPEGGSDIFVTTR